MLVFSRSEKVDVLGQIVPVAFNMAAITNFTNETGVSVFDLMNQLGTKVIIPSAVSLFWFALVEGCRITKAEVPCERAELETMDLEVFMAFVEVFNKSVENMTESSKKRLAAEGNKRKKAVVKA